MTPLLAALALVPQNPSPPGVRLPPGWKVTYWGATQAGRGAIVGPEGAEIAFTDYGATGKVASSIYLLDSKNLFVAASLAGRHVDAALATDGLLAVSFGEADPYVHYSSSVFDYWTKAPTGRRVAQALAVVLTRADFWKERPPDGDPPPPKGKDTRYAPPTLDRPFESMGEGSRLYTRRAGPGHGPAGVWFEKAGAATVESRADLPKDPKWTERATLLGGELVVQEGMDGLLAARFAPPGAPRTAPGRPVFTALEATPAATLLATFAAITYVKVSP